MCYLRPLPGSSPASLGVLRRAASAPPAPLSPDAPRNATFDAQHSGTHTCSRTGTRKEEEGPEVQKGSCAGKGRKNLKGEGAGRPGVTCPSQGYKK